MSNDKVIRAWKDEEFRLSLSAAERAELPPSPVGAVELSEAEMVGVLGGLGVAAGGGGGGGGGVEINWSKVLSCRSYDLYCKLTAEFNCLTAR